jgi:hypothetical protein
MPRTTAVLKALAAYRTWRLAQEAYAKAVEGGNPREITARYTELQTAHQEYIKTNLRGQP